MVVLFTQKHFFNKNSERKHIIENIKKKNNSQATYSFRTHTLHSHGFTFQNSIAHLITMIHILQIEYTELYTKRVTEKYISSQIIYIILSLSI